MLPLKESIYARLARLASVTREDAIEGAQHWNKTYAQVAEALGNIHGAKQLHYGDFVKSIQEDGDLPFQLTQCYSEVSRKFRRYRKLTMSRNLGSPISNDMLMDSLGDLANYAMLTLALIIESENLPEAGVFVSDNEICDLEEAP